MLAVDFYILKIHPHKNSDHFPTHSVNIQNILSQLLKFSVELHFLQETRDAIDIHY